MAVGEILFLSDRDVRRTIGMKDVLACAEDAYRRLGKGAVVCPPKTSLGLPGPGASWINAMPAVLKDDGVAGIKWVNVTFANRSRALPLAMGVIVLNDARTGAPIAILDGTWITTARTGASVAVGAKFLARKDSRTVAFLGAGDQAKAALEALSLMFPLRSVNVFSRTGASALRFVREAPPRPGLEVRACRSVWGAVEAADIIVAATTAFEPVMRAQWAKEGDFICGLSGLADLDRRLLGKSDKFLFDDNHCGLARIRQVLGLRLDAGRFHPDLCRVAAGKAPGREGDKEIITYVPIGLGAVDVVAALLAYRRAKRAGRGKKLRLFSAAAA